MIKVNEKQFVQILPTIMQNGGGVYVRPSTPLVHLGLDNDINEEYCINNNIPIFKVQRTGGAIVSNVNDYEFVIVNKDINYKKAPLLFEKLIHYLIKNNLNAKIENNDLLIDGYKVASYSYRKLENNNIYLAMHISMSVDLERIKNICKKEMKKVPKGLDEYGIYEEVIDNIIKELVI